MFEQKGATAENIYKKVFEKIEDPTKTWQQIQTRFTKLRRSYDLHQKDAKVSGKGGTKPTSYDQEQYLLWGKRPKFTIAHSYGCDTFKMSETTEVPQDPTEIDADSRIPCDSVDDVDCADIDPTPCADTQETSANDGDLGNTSTNNLHSAEGN